eukprot:TRINITY_DN4101_c0_g1_i1.p1 TRINITY_DN4101_c0_g1~~TRINITY_DN4101_c0_g1_i1.p1  ORF type:complete len:585 (+),score=217.10 TRINITY_DN4101_c0_g1_i1:24-1778(+)
MNNLVKSMPQPIRVEPQIVTNNKDLSSNIKTISKFVNIPEYGQRKGWTPRKLEDFGDGGAFPEIHVAQYPMNMGRSSKTQNNQLALKMDSNGKVRYDDIVKQNIGDKIVYSSAQDLVPLKELQDKMPERPDEETVEETTERTRKALERIVDGKIKTTSVKHVEGTNKESEYIRYTPNQRGTIKPQTKIIRMVEKSIDPLEPPKFKHKRVPNGPGSPPVPIMHSPPRKLTKEERDEWNIPPSISNWKNPGGFTIPLDKRLASDGRGLQDNQINENFAKFAESLYVAERNARDEVRRRSELRKEMQNQKKKQKEENIRNLARETRKDRSKLMEDRRDDHSEEEDDENEPERENKPSIRDYNSEEEDEEEDRQKIIEREKMRKEILREKDRERRLKKAGKFNTLEDRDISEKIALGENVRNSEESMFDQRLFNQVGGMGSGFGNDDEHNIYEKPLFEGTSSGTLYKPKHVDLDDNNDNDTSKSSKPNRGFSGTSEQDEQGSSSYRSGPVQFERERDEDQFGIEKFLSEAKNSTKKAYGNIGKSGSMSVSGSGNRDTYEDDRHSSNKRKEVNFDKSSSRDNKNKKNKK